MKILVPNENTTFTLDSLNPYDIYVAVTNTEAVVLFKEVCATTVRYGLLHWIPLVIHASTDVSYTNLNAPTLHECITLMQNSFGGTRVYSFQSQAEFKQWLCARKEW